MQISCSNPTSSTGHPTLAKTMTFVRVAAAASTLTSCVILRPRLRAEAPGRGALVDPRAWWRVVELLDERNELAGS